MSTWSIYHEPHGEFVTCQRPIVITTKVTAGVVAHFKGILYIKEGAAWVNTEAELNGYGDTNGQYYEFNVAEYCRNYFKEEDVFYNQQWCNTFTDMVEREFKLKIYPVEYDASGNLDPQPADFEYSREFRVVPVNTMARESTSSVNDNIRLDKYVLNGNNSSSVPIGSSSTNRLLSNMPDYNTIDISQGFFFFQNFLFDEFPGRDAVLELTNSSGVMQTLPATSLTSGYHYIHLHPEAIDFILSLVAGVPVNFLLDGAGNLTSSTLKAQYKFVDSATGAFVRSSPMGKYKLVDGMGCKSKTFIFRNMRGGFDFFTATGEHDVSVDIQGSEFDRHTDFNRGLTDFGLKRGQHNITNLWGNRKEMNTIFTQPVSTEYATWLEELIVSPQVWVVEDIKDYQGDPAMLFYNTKGLVAINILKGSYKLHNTEKGRHFIEFKYTLSENTTTQKM
jgi:hypothetical protein